MNMDSLYRGQEICTVLKVRLIQNETPKISVQPTLNPPSECQNGGIPNGNDTDCFCPMGYSGSKCEQIVCYNGGTPQGTKCVCLQNWWGDFCELRKLPVN